MKIGSIGYNHSHGKEFIMDRPDGNGCWLFLLIKTPAVVWAGGKRYETAANSYIIYSPKTQCRYHALGDVYTDDWIYFDADENDAEFFKRLGLPVDVPVYLGSAEEISHILHIMTYEHYSAEEYRAEVERRYTEIFFMKLSRILKSQGAVSSDAFAQKNTALVYIRTRIYNTPEYITGIDRLAQEAGMSRSGFQHLYKKIFGVSAITDLIISRTEKAKRLLTSTSLTVSEIAESCGYSNAYSFMRQFKERCGKTPTEYRKGI